MISAAGSVPVYYSADKVFEEALHSRHIPNHVGVLRLKSSDEILREDSVIQAKVGVGLLKFGMDAVVRELQQNRLLKLAGESHDARFKLAFDFSTNNSEFTSVDYDFGLELKSHFARKAEKLHGNDRTSALIGGFITGLVTNIQDGLAETYGPPQQLTA